VVAETPDRRNFDVLVVMAQDGFIFWLCFCEGFNLLELIFFFFFVEAVFAKYEDELLWMSFLTLVSFNSNSNLWLGYIYIWLSSKYVYMWGIFI
jgi:hypothetical protein